MKKLLLTVLLLSGCQLTTTDGQQHEFDAAATIATNKSDKSTSINRESTSDVDQMSFDDIVVKSWRYRQHLDQHDKKINLDHLEDLSPPALEKKHQQHLFFLQQLDSLNQQSLSTENQLNWQILRGQIQELADNYRFKEHYMPLTSEYGFHIGLAYTKEQYRFNTLKDYQHYLAKLAQFPRYFSQQQYWMTQGIKSGITQPHSVLAGFEDTIKNYITSNTRNSAFYMPFKKIDLDITPQQRLALETEALDIIEHKVIPSYQKFYDFMLNQYIPNARKTVAATALPNGRAYYDNRVKYYTTLDMNAEQVHQLGLSEVARIRGEMTTIIKSLKFDGSFADFLHFLRTDPQFYAKTPQQLLEKAAWLAKKADAILPQLFSTLPRMPYGVAAVPASIAPKYTTGRYKGSDNDSQPGFYWVNTYALDKRPLYVYLH